MLLVIAYEELNPQNLGHEGINGLAVGQFTYIGLELNRIKRNEQEEFRHMKLDYGIGYGLNGWGIESLELGISEDVSNDPKQKDSDLVDNWTMEYCREWITECGSIEKVKTSQKTCEVWIKWV